MVSILFFIKYFETNKYYHLLLSAIVFFIAMLFYETYTTLLFFICLFIFYHSIAMRGISTFKSKLFYKDILPFIIIGIAYVSAYFFYRLSIRGDAGFYSGTTFVANFNIDNFFKILWNYNLCVIPTYTYFASQPIIEANSLLATGHQNNFWYILMHSDISSIVNAFLQCFVFCYLCIKMNNKITWKKILIATILLLLLTFSMHIIVAISEKHNSSWAWSSTKGYITTFFSYFFIILLIGIFIYAGIKICYKNTWVKKGFIITMTLLLFYTSVIIGYSNDHLSREYQRSQNSFNMVDKVLKKGLFNDIPDDAIICAKELCTSSKMNEVIFWQSDCVWRDIVYIKTQKDMKIYDKIKNLQEELSKNTQPDIYYMSFYNSTTTQDMLLIFSKINYESINVNEVENMFYNATTNEAKVFYYSPNKDFTFYYYFPSCTQTSIALINGIEYPVRQGINASIIKNTDKNEEITSFIIKSSEPLLVKEFKISNIGK
jgi:hypothetical protein